MYQKYFTTDDNFEEIIKKYFPNFLEMKQVQTGWTNFVYKVKCANATYFFRFPRNDFFSDALIKEYYFTNFIRNKISFKVPSLKLKHDKKRPFTIHREIVGESLSDCYTSLTIEEKEKLAFDIMKLVYEFSKIDYKSLKFYNFQLVSNFLDNLSNVSQNGYDKKEHDYLKRLENVEKIISHGDLNPGNLILKDHKLVAVIDFSFAGLSSDLVDISRMIGRTPEDFRPMIICAYEKRFNKKIDDDAVEILNQMWHYVEEKYILYIKQNHPTIVLPSLV